MSYRYPAALVKPGLNTLVQGTPSYTYGLWSWGSNNYGQLGISSVSNKSSPNQVGSLTDWLQVASGYYHTIAVKNDGTLWSWGRGSSGQLGLGNTTGYSSPKQVGALTNWASVSAGHYSSFGIKSNGTLWAWGDNSYGCLGLGNTTYYSSPKQVGALTNWLQVASGLYNTFTLAIKTDGTLWAWGQNTWGQLGTSNNTSYSSPKQVGALTNWKVVSVGDVFAIATKTNGTIWSWGRDQYGQLGDNSTYSVNSPKQIGALTNWSKPAIRLGYSFSAAIKTDGTLWTWGRNDIGGGPGGQLGLNSAYGALSSPNQVGALTNWLSVTCGRYFMVANKTDGTMWSWGQSSSGQLGQSSTTQRSSPVQIGSLTTWYSPTTGDYFSFGLQY